MRVVLAIAICFLIVPLANAERFLITTFPVGDADQATPIIMQAYKMLGHAVEIEVVPAKRGIVAANQGASDGELIRIDGISANFPNLIQVPVPIINAATSVITSKSSRFQPMEWNDLKSVEFAIPLGVQILRMRTKGMGGITVSSAEALLKMVDRERIMAAVMPLTMALKFPKLIDKLRIVEPPIEVTPLYHYVHKKHRKIVPELARVLKEIQKK